MDEDHTGRYDGLYLSRSFPYALLEAKRYEHDLTDADTAQARSTVPWPHSDPGK